MKAAADAVRTQGLPQLATAQRQAFVAHYQELLVAGMQLIPHPRAASEAARVGEADPAQNLLERLWQGQVLAFLHGLTIPFDNHQAERDLCMLKVQRNISSAFRFEGPRRRSRAAAATCPA